MNPKFAEADPNLYNQNEEVQPSFQAMQPKFAEMQVENAQMFDSEALTKNQPKMEPIEEGYSSEDSYVAQQKYKNFKDNLEYFNEQSKRPMTAMPAKGKRNHINLRTGKVSNKENVNYSNQDRVGPIRAPQTVKKKSKKFKRSSTGKMKTTMTGFRSTNTFRNTNGFRSTYSRPKTAKTKRPGTKKITKYNKKSDPVARYQQMQNSWSKHKLSKGGRKLDLAGFNRWAKMVQSTPKKAVVKQVHRYINPNEPLASNKRDDLRFHLRAKMSQKDYVDSNMKYFHYMNSKS